MLQQTFGDSVRPNSCKRCFPEANQWKPKPARPSASEFPATHPRDALSGHLDRDPCRPRPDRGRLGGANLQRGQ